MPEVIRLENVSKKFIIHHEKKRSFQEWFVSRFRSNGSSEEFWALKDVSFGVRKGETVGLIGQNGSGKSTLLKLVSRIIEPTQGKVTVNGTMSSLLELGAGFHPDLTGRDNVFLNGSLLGFSRREMERLFDDIVAFSELEQFIDVPVKHYSSGMYMRLAFAVAINVNPDILLIDEVLSVGDKAFQDKCLEKIRDFQSAGKTILFVTHSLETVKNICSRAVWLDHGKIRSMGERKKVVLDYLRQVDLSQENTGAAVQPQKGPYVHVEQPEADLGSGGIRIRDVKILSGERVEKRVFATGDDLVVRLHYAYRDRQVLPDCVFSVSISDASGTLVHKALRPLSAARLQLEKQRGLLELRYGSLPLLEGMYSLSIAVQPNDTPDSPLDVYHHPCKFSIKGGLMPGGGPEEGLISLEHRWIDPTQTLSAAACYGESAEVAGGAIGILPDGCPVGSTEHLPSHVYMGENEARCLGEGWHEVEGPPQYPFRWTASRASLFLAVPESASNLFLKVSDYNASFRHLEGRVLVDGVPVGEFARLGLEITSLRFPLNGVSHGKVGIAIEVEPTVAPVRVGLNDDMRQLGVVVWEIWAE